VEERDATIIRFRRYGAWLIFVPALIAALVVAWGVRGVMVQGYGRMVAAGVNGFVSEAYRGGQRGMPDEQARLTLHRIFADRIRENALTSVEIIDSDGRVLYSTESNEIGLATQTGETESQSFALGSITTSVLRDEEGLQLALVAPVTADSSDRVESVLRVTRPYAPIAQSVRRTVAAIIFTIMLGATVVWALMSYLIRRTERELNQQAEQVSELNRRLRRSLTDIERHSMGTLQALNAAVDAKDTYTSRHSMNVADYSCAIARQLGHVEMIEDLEKAGLLHDIGKIGVAEQILTKPAALSAEEFDQVKEHSRIGAGIIQMLPFLHPVVPIVLYHHERWDGKGYPDGLSEEQIPLGARILCVADAFDSMTTQRPYRGPLDLAGAKRELLAGRGKQFDPAIIDALVTAVEDNSMRWLGDGPAFPIESTIKESA
jgi:putative nucleotidyltransferase with HDIG domain